MNKNKKINKSTISKSSFTLEEIDAFIKKLNNTDDMSFIYIIASIVNMKRVERAINDELFKKAKK